ncbi:MAG: cation:proton antiporter, partial [Anaerolineales bacterium]
MGNNDASLDIAGIFIELGIIIIIMAMLARFARRLGFSPIPLYLLAGLALGTGAILPLDLPDEFVQVGAELGVILLLFMLGLAYRSDELTNSLRNA